MIRNYLSGSEGNRIYRAIGINKDKLNKKI